MTIWYVDIMWAFMLFGITVFCGALVVVNRAMRSMRTMCLLTCYAVGVWMAITLEWKVALVTWCVFAAFGGGVVFAYELWARYRYAGTGRTPRPLILLQGFVLWPALLPEAIEDMVIDTGILPPHGDVAEESKRAQS